MTPDPHPSWYVLDSTKLKSYMGCPRKFFFEYVLGWRPDDGEYDLNFGIAVHEAMEVLMESRVEGADPGYSNETIEKAYDAFITRFNEMYPDSFLSIQHTKKNPERVMDMLRVYQKTNQNDDFTLVQKETSGSISINREMDATISFRIDGVVKDRLGYHIMDHKTSGWSEYLARKSHELSIQMKTYIHVLHSIYGAEGYGGVLNMLLFATPPRTNKDGSIAKNASPGNKTFRIPFRFTHEMMLDWWYDVNDLVKEIYENLRIYREQDTEEGTVIMRSFKKRETNCLAFNRVCPYHDFCTSCANPALLAQQIDIPAGFHEKFWDPTEEGRQKGGQVIEL